MFENEKAVVMKWLEMVQGGKDQVWDSYLTMDPSMTWTLIGSTPISGTHNGIDQIENVFWARCWNGDGREGSGPQGLDPNYGIKPLEVVSVTALEDGRVLVHCKSDGCGKNGVAYKNEYAWVIKVENGKMVSLHEFADTALIERAMFDKKIVPAEQCAV
jgi:hypothetical protein